MSDMGVKPELSQIRDELQMLTWNMGFLEKEESNQLAARLVRKNSQVREEVSERRFFF